MSHLRPALFYVACFVSSFCVRGALAADPAPLQLGVFAVDVSPPVGSPLAYDPCDAVGMSLSARGVVLLGAGEPIVLCAVDWIGLANGGRRRWCEELAAAAGTTTSRVAVHTLHQHDAPRCDFDAEQLLAQRGLGGVMFDPVFARDAVRRVAAAVGRAVANVRPVTHLGLGEANVEQVASNRRILGPDGKVRAVRYTACADPALRAEPEGTIDPALKSITLYYDDEPLVVLTYYATHPQSYYRTGVAHADFPGMARALRQETLNGLPHVHFNGAGGNIGAGKYNDGAPENRQLLAVRLATGMAQAHAATRRISLAAADVDWTIEPVALPVAEHLDEAELLAQLDDPAGDPQAKTYAAKDLVWLRRCLAGETIDVACLSLGPARILHLPGELAVEYQLAAQAMRPDLFVATAAYGEYAPGYICMRKHYDQGGYEASPGASKVSPDVEGVLMSAMKKLLD